MSYLPHDVVAMSNPYISFGAIPEFIRGVNTRTKHNAICVVNRPGIEQMSDDVTN